MAMRREESDGRVVLHGRRKTVPTAHRARGGKATTASKQAGQQHLFLETADSPQGAVPGTRTGQPASRARHAVPKSRNTSGVTLPAMTMEEVANDDNLRGAFADVAQNRGAPGAEPSHAALCRTDNVSRKAISARRSASEPVEAEPVRLHRIRPRVKRFPAAGAAKHERWNLRDIVLV
jgi:hypothetical protein